MAFTGRWFGDPQLVIKVARGSKVSRAGGTGSGPCQKRDKKFLSVMYRALNRRAKEMGRAPTAGQ